MSNTTSDVSAELKLYGMGKRFRAGHAAATPPMGDRMINALRSVLREAWEMGKDDFGSPYPSVPLLDQLTTSQPEHEQGEQAMNYGVAFGGARKEKLPKRMVKHSTDMEGESPSLERGDEGFEPGLW